MSDAPPKKLTDRAELFQRLDGSDDRDFYTVPRLVIHVDEAASAVLSAFFEAMLPPGGNVLDLMSAWRSHLPQSNKLGAVIGLGMNEVELAENPVLAAGLVHDLNKNPSLPFTDEAFDAVLILFSLQYLLKPVDVLADAARVLRPGGTLYVAFTNRLFPTKAVAVWQQCDDVERAHLIGHYLDETRMFNEATAECLVKPDSGGDPLYVVSAATRPVA